MTVVRSSNYSRFSMEPARTRTVPIVTGVAIQEEEWDGERHRTGSDSSVHSPDMARYSQSANTSSSQMWTCSATIATSSENWPVLTTDGMSTTSDTHKSTSKTTPASGVKSLTNVRSETKKFSVATEGYLQSPEMNDLRDLKPVSSVFDTSSEDRLQNGRTESLALTAASSATATSGSFNDLLHISGSVRSLKDSDKENDWPTESTTGAMICWCQRGNVGNVCKLCDFKTRTPTAHQLGEASDGELGGDDIKCPSREQSVDEKAEKTGSEREMSNTDGKLLENSECEKEPECEKEHENIKMIVHASGIISVTESRKRKFGQSGMSVLDATASLGLFKHARVEDNCNFINNICSQNQFEVQHKLPGKLSMKSLTQLGGKRKHIIMNDTRYENTGLLDVHTDDLCVDLRTCTHPLDGQRRLESSVPVRISDIHYVCVDEQLAAGMSGCEGPTQTEPEKLGNSETQQDLWSRMEVLCEQTQDKVCGDRWRVFSTLADSILKRSSTENKSVFQPELKVPTSSNARIRSGSHVAKHLLGYDDDYHCSHIKTGTRIGRTSSKARARSIQKKSSTPGHMAPGPRGRHRYRFRSNSSSGWSSRSRSRSHSPPDSCRSHSCDSDKSDECVCDMSLEHVSDNRCHCQYRPRSSSRCFCCHARHSESGLSHNRLKSSRSFSRSLSLSRYKHMRSHNPHGLGIIKQLLNPLVLPSSVTTLIVAPVTGAATAGKAGSVGNSVDKHPTTTTSSSPEKAKRVNGGQNVFLPSMEDKNRYESKGSNEASPEENANMSLPSRPQNMTSTRVSGNSEHYTWPQVRSANHFGEHCEQNLQREQPRYEQHFNHMGYHPGPDYSFSEDTGYEFYGGEYDYLYDERNDEYSFGNEPYPPHLHRHPGPNTYYPRRPPPQGPRGPPQMFTSNDRSYGPPRLGMGGPSSRMGPNGPVGSRGSRSPMGPRGHRPQGGPGGPLGPPVMRGPPRGSPYGPPRGSPYGPPGPMRPQGMRGPPGPGMMGQTGHGGPSGPRPRGGPPARMASPMARQGSQPPTGLRPRMGPPPSGPGPRDDQYLAPRPGILPSNPGDSSFCSPMPNLSQPPPNFVPPTSSLPPTTTTPAAGSAGQITEVVEPPPPLPPPKPPTPKPPPPPKKEEEKKEEIKPMTPLIPPEQAEQYRKLREQARKHARKQQRKQEHQAKGEPESSDDDDEEKAKRKEYEAKLAVEREEMEKAALLAVQDNGALHFEEGAAILMPATQPTLIQQPTMMVQHHPMTTLPSSYGLMPASQFVHASHPGLHPSQLQNLQIMASTGQAQLVQLPNGQMAYATAAPMAYQAATAPMVAMQHQAMQHQAMQAGAVPHHVFMSPGGMHQVPMTAHPGLAVSSSQYMAHMMASQVQAAQIQAAQAAQIQAAQAAQIQAAQAAQIQAAQAAQVQAAQVAQAQAAQAAQVQAAQAQVQSSMPGMVPGVHMAQHVLPGSYPQGQYILVPRVARPQT